MQQWRNRGFWVVVAYPCIVVLLSALGFTNHVVWGVAAFGILPFLMGALAWRRGRSKNGLLWILALVLSVPLTRWPLQLTFSQSQACLLSLERKALARAQITVHSAKTKDCVSFCDEPSRSLGPDNDGGEFLDDYLSPYILRYPVTAPLQLFPIREVRLWHQKGGYALVEFPTRFGVVVQHRWYDDNSWRWELGEEH